MRERLQANAPALVLARAAREVGLGDLDPVAVGVLDEVARGQDLQVVDGLYLRVDVVVVDVALDALLADLVHQWPDVFVGNGCGKLSVVGRKDFSGEGRQGVWCDRLPGRHCIDSSWSTVSFRSSPLSIAHDRSLT